MLKHERRSRALNSRSKQFNDAGGLAGRQVELLVRDDKLNAGEAATRTLELIEKDKVHAVVGALSSAVQLAVNEVTRARGMIYISISQSDTINEAKDWSRFTFHEALNPHMTTAAVAKHMFQKGTKIAYLAADYAYGHEMVRGFKRAQTGIGAEAVGEIFHPLGASDYSTFLPRISAMKADILCICNFGRDQANSIKQAVEFGLKQQMRIVVPVLLHNQRLAVGADAFEGIVGGSNYYWGLEKTIPSAKAFNDAFRAVNEGTIPTDYGAYAYTAVKSLLQAHGVAWRFEVGLQPEKPSSAQFRSMASPLCSIAAILKKSTSFSMSAFFFDFKHEDRLNGLVIALPIAPERSCISEPKTPGPDCYGNAYVGADHEKCEKSDHCPHRPKWSRKDDFLQCSLWGNQAHNRPNIV